MRLARGVPDVRVAGAGGDHHAFDHLPHLFLGAGVPGGQLSYRAVDIGLAPQHGRPVVEQFEVVQVVSFLLHDLKLYVLVIQVGIESG
jgi:hypothetical protein